MTIEEIRAAAGKQPELLTAILSSFQSDYVTAAPSLGLVVRTKDQDQQFLDNHVNTVVNDRVNTRMAAELQPKVDQEFGNAMNKIDEEIKSITGVEKKPGEKTTAYAKRAVEEKRQGGDPVTKEKVTELEGLLAKQKTEFETKLQQSEENAFNREIGFGVDSYLGTVNIAVPAHLKTDEEKQAYVNMQKGLIRQGFTTGYSAKKDADGKTVFYKDGKPQMSAQDGKALAAGDIIKTDYSAYFVPAGQSGSGSGTGGNGNAGTKPEGGFKDKAAIHSYLAANGVALGTKEYNDQLETLATESKIEL